VLDVGQGDSIFDAFPGGKTLLVDGGGSYGASRIGGMRTGLDIGEQVVSSYLWQRGIERLDAVALSHAHNDHLDGLHAVLENFRVDELWYGREVDSPAFRSLLAQARRRGTRLRQMRRGNSFEWDGATGLVLWPEDVSRAAEASNNDSLVLRVESGGKVVLLTGDVERPVEEELLARGDPLEADFLKVAHHASRSSTMAPFLAASRPQIAAASFGADNPFGYPHRELVDRLCAAHLRFLRTDRDGAATFFADQHSLHVRSHAEEADLPGRQPTPCIANAAAQEGSFTPLAGAAKKRPGAKAGSKPKKRSPGKRQRKPKASPE
jgi:competence protein ComEC